MKVDFKRIETLVNKNTKDKKRYSDLNFLFCKTKYHTKLFTGYYPRIIKEHEEIDKIMGLKSSQFLFDQISKITHIDKKQLSDSKRKINVNIHRVNIKHPLFYEFDTIMIDSKRAIEYILKLIASLMGINRVNDIEVQNFFEGLTGENPNKSKFCKCIDDYSKYTKYLKDSWKEWIKDLNQYRTNTIHKSITIKPKTTVTTYYEKGTDSQKPEKMEISGVQFQNKDMLEYINYLNGKINDFLRHGFLFIQDNLCK